MSETDHHIMNMRINLVLLLMWFVLAILWMCHVKLHDAVVLLGFFTVFGLVNNLSHEASHFARRGPR